jgi:hypothetical protein
MAFNINEIQAQLTLGGARPSLFQVFISNPVTSVSDLKVPFMVRAAQLPASTLGLIEVPYFGRKVKIAGDRTFAEWTTTVVNDEDFLVRNALENWMNDVNSHQGNVRNFASANDQQYKSQATVTQYSKTGVPIREYKFHGLWPINLSEIELDWNTTDTLEEFAVTWQYDFWEVSGGITGNAGGT